MFSSRFPANLALALGLALLAEPTAHAAGSSCGASSLTIDAVPSNPFTADVVQGAWEVLPDGTRKLLPPTGKGDLSKMPDPMLLFQVARDSEGRVMVKSGLRFSTKNGVQTGGPYAGGVTICDPIEGTITTISHSVRVTGAEDRATGNRTETVTLEDGKAQVKSWENHSPMISYRIPNQIEEDRGFEQVDGVQIDRVRFRRSDDDVAEGVFRERWLSEQLAVVFAMMRTNSAENIEKGIRLTNVHRDEPNPDLYSFQIPAGYKVVHDETEPPASERQAVETAPCSVKP